MGDYLGGQWLPCHVNSGYSYNTVPGYGGSPDGGNQITNYVIQCCQAGVQMCSANLGCIGAVDNNLLTIQVGPDSIAMMIYQMSYNNVLVKNSGCRSPQYANFSPDHMCDCDGTYIAPWGESSGQSTFAGNTDCCSNDMFQWYPQECINQIENLGGEIGSGVGNYGLDPECWNSSAFQITNPYFTPQDILYFYDYYNDHGGYSDTDSTIVDVAPCFYGCNDPLAGNYDPDATCSSFPHCRNHPDCGNCIYYTTAPEPEQDEERPEKPEVSPIKPEKPEVSSIEEPETPTTEPVSGETETKINLPKKEKLKEYKTNPTTIQGLKLKYRRLIPNIESINNPETELPREIINQMRTDGETLISSGWNPFVGKKLNMMGLYKHILGYDALY